MIVRNADLLAAADERFDLLVPTVCREPPPPCPGTPLRPGLVDRRPPPPMLLAPWSCSAPREPDGSPF